MHREQSASTSKLGSRNVDDRLARSSGRFSQRVILGATRPRAGHTRSLDDSLQQGSARA